MARRFGGFRPARRFGCRYGRCLPGCSPRGPIRPSASQRRSAQQICGIPTWLSTAGPLLAARPRNTHRAAVHPPERRPLSGQRLAGSSSSLDRRDEPEILPPSTNSVPWAPAAGHGRVVLRPELLQDGAMRQICDMRSGGGRISAPAQWRLNRPRDGFVQADDELAQLDAVSTGLFRDSADQASISARGKDGYGNNWFHCE